MIIPLTYMTRKLRDALDDNRMSPEDRADIVDELRLREDTAITLERLVVLGIFALAVVLWAQWDLSNQAMCKGAMGHEQTNIATTEGAMSQPASQPTTPWQAATASRPAGASEPAAGAGGGKPNSPATSTSGKGLTAESSKTSNGIGLALLWSLAMFGVGSLVGFVFGVPKLAQDVDTKPSVNGAAGEGTKKGRSRIRPNASLEEISDWLTKIIVGVGLVEAKDIGGRIYVLSEIISAKECGVACVSLALGIIITFVTIGFLMGYFATRMFLSPLFGRADGITGRICLSYEGVKDKPVGLIATGDEASIDSTTKEEAHRAIEQTEAAKGSGPFEARYLRAKSLLLAGEYYGAAAEYGALVAERPADVKLRRERLWAMFKRGPLWNAEMAGAVKALDEMSGGVSADEARDVYLSLTFHYLYAGTLEAAGRVVKLVQEYEARQLRPVAGIYINLACAYGQLAKFQIGDALSQLMNAGADEIPRIRAGVTSSVSEQARNAAAAAQKAIRASPEGAKSRLRELLSAGGNDDDLSDPQVANAVRNVLDLPTATA